MDQEALESLVAIALVAALAPFIADLLERLRLPVVVVDIGLGIVIGPQVLGLATLEPFVQDLADLGLAFLIFLAGTEIDLDRVKGRPLGLAVRGWLLSLVLGIVVVIPLVVEGFVTSDLLVGLALTATALGTLLPIMRDSGRLGTPFGAHVLAIGAAGEFGPIVAVALLFAGDAPARTAVFLVVFVVLALLAAWLALRPFPERMRRVLTAGIESSAQVPVRFIVLVVIAMLFVASDLGLDVLLGAFVAGVVVRLWLRDADPAQTEPVLSKLDGIGFGFLVPLFFVVTGMRFDLEALTTNALALAELPLYLALFLVVRGLPAVLLYRRDVERAELLPLSLLSATTLPLVVVITTIGLDTGRMDAGTAAALVGAAMVSVFLYPLLALTLLGRRRTRA